MSHKIKISTTISELPNNWDEVVGYNNILLSTAYFSVLQDSRPQNMECFFVEFFQDYELIGGALFQYLNFENHNVLQKNEISCSIRNFLTKKFSKEILILGNNMLTGQNGFYFNSEKIKSEIAISLLEKSIQQIQSQIKKTFVGYFKRLSIFCHSTFSNIKI